MQLGFHFGGCRGAVLLLGIGGGFVLAAQGVAKQGAYLFTSNRIADLSPFTVLFFSHKAVAHRSDLFYYVADNAGALCLVGCRFILLCEACDELAKHFVARVEEGFLSSSTNDIVGTWHKIEAQ